MDNILKKPYEISLWDDDLVWVRRAIDTSKKIEGFTAQEIDIEPVANPDWYDFNLLVEDEYNELKNYYVLSEKGWEKAEGEPNYGVWYEAKPIPQEIVQYYKERKICIIGSDTMDTPVKATSGKLVSNVNGSNTLTFNMFSRYYDEDTEQFYDNPFLKLLVNERKVKLRYGALGSEDCKWYDFVIKDVKKNSENKTFNYTCKDLFINELSKSGFSIQLDPELENNMGNITYLAEKILEESDWKLGQQNDVITQTKEEPLYKIILNSTIRAKDMQDKTSEIELKEDDVIYAFYSIITNEEPYFQFLYRQDGKYEIDDDHVITNSPNYFIEGVTYEDNLPSFAKQKIISSEYRGDKLIRQALTKFDPTIDKYVNVYQKQATDDAGNPMVDENQQPVYERFYGYAKTEYITPTAVSTYITNGEGFTSDTGWKTGGYKNTPEAETEYPTLDLIAFPDPRDIPTTQWAEYDDYRSFLRFKRSHATQILCNSGFADHRSAIKTLALDEKFVIRAKIGMETSTYDSGRPKTVIEPTVANTQGIQVVIAEYTLEKGVYTLGTTYMQGNFQSKQETFKKVELDIDEYKVGKFYIYNDQSKQYSLSNEAYDKDEQYYERDYWYYLTSDEGNVIKSLVAKSYTDLINARIGIFFKTPLDGEVYFEDIQFYKYVEYEKLKEGSDTEFETVVAEPGGELFSAARTKYVYYIPNSSYKSEDDLIPVYEGYTENEDYIKVYNDNQFEKVRSITASESNRFNMIQDLCETFECWAKFEIDHNQQTGEILLDDEYRQRKWVTFHEYIGKDNYVGFRYGINLKSISRTLNSDGIVSKIIVKNNANEFAPNGFCSIARAPENPTGENFIFHFNYYIQQGLIERAEVNNDLYMTTNGYLGYYTRLKDLNKHREAKIEEQSQLLLDMSQYQANYQTYKLSVESAEEELRDTEQYIIKLTGSSLSELQNDPDNEWWDDNALLAKVNKVAQLNSLIAKHTQLRDLEYKLNEQELPESGRLFEAEAAYAELQQYIDDLASQKRALNLQFYKKYSRFIQEGSWISEDYVDENLYYLDAESTLFTSAQPKVTYTINVLELSQLEGYENYRFALGDKTYIEDTEFFGWVWSKNGVKTPYHEEIVISEFTVELDSPEKNTFKVQNFKTQFEDLFQRITATTQSVEYHTGEYGRASSIVQTDGTISGDTLQNSMTNNAIRLENAKDQSVVWDETGITTTSLSNPSEIVRIVSGGVFLSIDGGSTWGTGITGAGINASYLTAGQINASVVNIMSGSYPSFRWDDKGINAFAFAYDPTTKKAYDFNTSKFVRYDQYGIYGIDGQSGFEPQNENDIWQTAKYALTWKGFMLRTNKGSVKISSDEDIQVFSGDFERIKIGEIGSNKYGIRISKEVKIEGISTTVPVMVTDDDGELWLENRLKIGDGTYSTVELGYLDETREENNKVYHEVIHAGTESDEFIVYEDGKVVANYIEAKGGKIGNMTITSIEQTIEEVGQAIEAGKKLDISSNLGYNFKVGGNGISPEQLQLVAEPTGFTIYENDVIWYGTQNPYQEDSWVELYSGSPTFNLTYEFFKQHCLHSTYYIKATCLGTDVKEYEAQTTIMSISDGEDPVTLVITTSNGNYFRNDIGQTTLTARLFKAGQEIDLYPPYEYVYQWADANDDSWKPPEGNNKTLVVKADEVSFSRTYVCNVSKGG